MRLRHQAARGLKWQALDIAGRQLLSLAVFSVLARLLQPADFGLIGFVGVYLTFVNLLVDFGTGTALVQRRTLEPAHLDTAFWFNVLCAATLCLLTLGFAASVANIAQEPRLAPLLQWASIGLIINATGAVQAAIFVKDIDFKYLTYRTLVGNAVGGGIAVAMAIRGYGVWALIAQQLITSLVAVCFLWAVSPWRPSARFSLTHLRELMGVSLSVFATSVLWTFTSRIDQLVIGRFAGAATLGYYVVGVRLAEVARNAIHEPMSAISMPALSKVQDDHERLRHAIYGAMELHAVVCFAVFGGLAAIAPSVVPLVFGPQWHDAGRVLQMVAIYSLAVTLTVLFHPALLASGGVGRYVFINAAGAIGAAAACLIGIRFGVRTMVLFMTVNILLTGAVALVFLRQRIHLSMWRFCRPCIVPAAAATVMFLAVLATRLVLSSVTPLWARTAAEVAVGASVYLSAIWMFASATVQRFRELATVAVVPMSGSTPRFTSR